MSCNERLFTPRVQNDCYSIHFFDGRSDGVMHVNKFKYMAAVCAFYLGNECITKSRLNLQVQLCEQ
jgi:hypothetical protein